MRSAINKTATLPTLTLLAYTLRVCMASGVFWTATYAGEVDPNGARARAGIEDIDTTGSVGLVSTLPLNDEQRGLVFLGITSLPDVPVADGRVPRMSTVAPASIDLQD